MGESRISRAHLATSETGTVEGILMSKSPKEKLSMVQASTTTFPTELGVHCPISLRKAPLRFHMHRCEVTGPT